MRPPRDGARDVRRDTEEEIRQHVELRTKELIRRGWTPEAAHREALRRFGSMDRDRRALVRAALNREGWMRAMGWWEGIRLDAKLALRGLSRRPGFTAAAVLTLALGVGANAALFSVVRDALLDPLPFPEPEQLVRIHERTGEGEETGNVSVPNLRELRERSRTLEQVGRFQFARVRGRFGTETELLPATLVERELFDLLGRAPLLGRLPEEGEEDVVVVSHRLWKSRLGGDSEALGRTMELEGDPYVVVGVMPPDFAITSSEAALWAILPPPEEYMLHRRVHVSGAVARVRAGIGPEAVRDDLAAVSAAVEAEYPGEDPGHTFAARALRDSFTGYARTPLLLLAGGVLLVLLIACANIAGLQLARAASRESEMGIRLALGAGRGVLLRQLLVENVLLFATGAVVSAPVAVIAVRWLVTHAPGGVPRSSEIAVDAQALLLAFLTAAGLGLVFGLVPAVHAARTTIAGALGGRDGGVGRRSSSRARRVLVVGQLALSVALLAGAGLLIRSLWELQIVDPGFRAEKVAVLRVALPDGYAGEQVPAFYRRVPEALASIPGLEAVSATSDLPVSGGDGRGEVAVEGRTFDPGAAPSATFRRVLPGYFGVMGIPLVAGREFTGQDGEGEPVVLVNASMAERLFPDGDVLGRRIKVGPGEGEPWLTVVGVVGDVRNETLEAIDRFATYEPHAQRPRTSMYVVARGRGPAADLVVPLREALLELEPRLYVYEAGTMTARMEKSTAGRRFIALLLGAFALVALLLGTVGVYGLTAYTVSQRKREVGIRAALGATDGSILRLLVGESARIGALGLVLGLGAAAGLVRLIQGLLYGVSPLDPLTLGGVALVLGGATLVASWLPARRVRSIDPASVLSGR